MNGKKTAVIIGAGPAGLTAGYEFLVNSDIRPVVLEATPDIGGISKTVKYKNNRIDIGGHRFFSKSDKIMNWWFSFMSLQTHPAKDYLKLGRDIELAKSEEEFDPEKKDNVFLVRQRLSRIFFLKKFFPYPPTLNLKTLNNLGTLRVGKIFLSYIRTRLKPLLETNLENLYINHFGRELYSIFFEDYTKKLWGIECREISADWGRQRVKGVSISKTIVHAINQLLKKSDIKKGEISLIDKFYYPKFGPGHLYESVAKRIIDLGGEVKTNARVIKINLIGNNFSSVIVRNEKTGEEEEIKGDYFLSTMPIKDLVKAMPAGRVPEEIFSISQGLLYRDLITVGLLVDCLEIKNETEIKTLNNLVPDTWIYIQDREVKMNRLQIFNNWSPYLIEDLSKVWLGVEYTCSEGDELDKMGDKALTDFAISELEKIKIIKKENVTDSVVIRMPKAYPAYFGTFNKFDKVKKFIDGFENFFPIGRNGMHRYNNMDHSMLTAMAAVENVINGRTDKENIWQVNAEQEYHEERK